MATVDTVRGPVELDALGATLMQKRGVTDDRISTMVVDNPRRYVTPAG